MDAAYADFLDQLRSESDRSAAFGVLVVRYRGLMSHVIRQFYSCSGVSLPPEDAVQETLISVLRWAKQGCPNAPNAWDDFRRWLCRVARCRAVDAIRKDVRYAELLANLERPEQ